MPFPIVTTVVAFIVLSICVDARSRRIPNPLSASAILLGLGLNSFYYGAWGLLGSLGGLAAAVAALLGPFALGGIGGGDVKMMGAVGALVGARLALTSLALGMLLGGVIMIAHLASKGLLREKLAAMYR